MKIKEIRKRKGITQKELAQRLGVTASAVSQYEKPGANLTQETLQKIAAALDCRVIEVTEGAFDWNDEIDETPLPEKYYLDCIGDNTVLVYPDGKKVFTDPETLKEIYNDVQCYWEYKLELLAKNQ